MRRFGRCLPTFARMENDKAARGAGFLSKKSSQLLCLQDALESRASRTMLHALRAVADTNGLDQLARDASIDVAELKSLVEGDDHAGDADVADLLSRLIANLRIGRAGSHTNGNDKK